MTDYAETLLDPEALAVAYLNERLAADTAEPGAAPPVLTTFPKPVNGRRVARFVRVSVTGGALRNLVLDEAAFVIEAHDDVGNSDRAVAVANQLRSYLRDWPERDTRVLAVRETSRPVNRVNPDTGAPAYRLSVDVTLRSGVAA